MADIARDYPSQYTRQRFGILVVIVCVLFLALLTRFFLVQVAQGTDVTATGNTSSTVLPVNGAPVTGGLITIGTPPAPVTAGEPLGFAGGCGCPAGMGLPLLPLLPLIWTLWFLVARRRKED